MRLLVFLSWFLISWFQFLSGMHSLSPHRNKCYTKKKNSKQERYVADSTEMKFRSSRATEVQQNVIIDDVLHAFPVKDLICLDRDLNLIWHHLIPCVFFPFTCSCYRYNLSHLRGKKKSESCRLNHAVWRQPCIILCYKPLVCVKLPQWKQELSKHPHEHVMGGTHVSGKIRGRF